MIRSKVKEFNLFTIDAINEINKKLEKLGLDADNVISIQKTVGTYTVWYREDCKEK